MNGGKSALEVDKRETLSWRDRGIIASEVLGLPERKRKVGLKQWKIAFDLDKMKDLTAPERERLSKYSDLSLYAWSPENCSGPDDLEKMFLNVSLMLNSGWSANHKQWDNQDCSMVEMIGEDLNGVDGGFAITALACPGFGMSELKSGFESKDNQSDEEYAWVQKWMLGKLKATIDTTEILGHSAGTLPCVANSNAYKAYLINPSLHLNRNFTFEFLDRASMMGTPFIETKVKGVALTVVSLFTKGFTTRGGGSSESMNAQTAVFEEEQAMHYQAFVAKGEELADGDKLVTPPQIMCRYLATEGDSLTSAKLSREWLRAWVSTFKRPEEADGYLAEMGINISTEMSRSLGHNDIFINQEACKIVAREVANSLRAKLGIVLLPNLTSEAAVVERGESKENPEAERKAFNLLLMQGFTLGFEVKTLEIIEGLAKNNKSVIKLTSEDARDITRMYFMHPFIEKSMQIGNLDNLDGQKMGDIVSRYYANYDGDSEITDVLFTSSLVSQFSQEITQKKSEILSLLGFDLDQSFIDSDLVRKKINFLLDRLRDAQMSIAYSYVIQKNNEFIEADLDFDIEGIRGKEPVLQQLFEFVGQKMSRQMGM